jgi:hypothetical protein
MPSPVVPGGPHPLPEIAGVAAGVRSHLEVGHDKFDVGFAALQ